ncbi:polyprenyl synthetase family protein, partial [Staphylococcus aureus]
LRHYGEALGMAFQLVDDALDYQASEAALGKAIGDDFRDGKVTLPVLIAYAGATAEEQQFWQEALEQGERFSPESLKRAKQLLTNAQACEKTI